MFAFDNFYIILEEAQSSFRSRGNEVRMSIRCDVINKTGAHEQKLVGINMTSK